MLPILLDLWTSEVRDGSKYVPQLEYCKIFKPLASAELLNCPFQESVLSLSIAWFFHTPLSGWYEKLFSMRVFPSFSISNRVELYPNKLSAGLFWQRLSTWYRITLTGTCACYNRRPVTFTIFGTILHPLTMGKSHASYFENTNHPASLTIYNLHLLMYLYSLGSIRVLHGDDLNRQLISNSA